MPKLPTVDELMKSISDAATSVLKKDVTTISGFTRSQHKKLATFAIWIGEAELAGEFRNDPGLRDDFLHSLQDMTRDFVNTLRGLTMISIEKTWNAIVDVIWNALDKATGLKLLRPI
jgi:hypothetical protein